MEVVFIIGTVTQATRAVRALSAGSVRAQTKKISSDRGGRGCIWGIRFDRRHLYTAMDILTREGISYEIQ